MGKGRKRELTIEESSHGHQLNRMVITDMRVVSGGLCRDLGLKTGHKGLERQGLAILAQEQWK